MAVATVDFEIQPSDGWTLIATNPTSLIVRPSTPAAWKVAAVAAGVPATSLKGLIFGKDRQQQPYETFESGPISGLVYIAACDQLPNKQHFGVVRDQ